MALIKGLLLLTGSLLFTVLLLRVWLREAPTLARWLGVSASVLLVVLSALDLYGTLFRVTGFVEWEMYARYLNSTRHGAAVKWRAGLALLLLALSLLPARRWQAALALPAWMAVLFTFSYTSHASAMAGPPALLIDWVHFLAGGAWIGIILAALLARSVWRNEERLIAMMRAVSATGLASVVVILTTGGVSSLFHVAEPERFFGSPYSWSLAVKIALVLITIVIAGVNRFVHLRALLGGGGAQGLRRTLTIEAALLILVFAATGVLTTSALPHGQDFPGLLENIERLLTHLRSLS